MTPATEDTTMAETQADPTDESAHMVDVAVPTFWHYIECPFRGARNCMVLWYTEGRSGSCSKTNCHIRHGPVTVRLAPSGT
jgi:hypothetical protein